MNVKSIFIVTRLFSVESRILSMTAVDTALSPKQMRRRKLPRRKERFMSREKSPSSEMTLVDR